MLIVGKPVPGTVLDREGKVLLRAGTPLDQQTWQRLQQRGDEAVFAGPDWPDRWPPGADSPRKLACSLASRDRQRRHRRRHERHACRVPVTVELAEHTLHGTWVRRFEARTLDVSAGGMAFEHEHYVHPGTELVAYFDKLPGRPRVRGVVRNCHYTERRRHRVGVEFLEARRGDDDRSDG